MKVCHVTSVHSQGDTRVFHKECVSLAKAGYDTYLVVSGESCEKNGVHIVGVGQLSGGRISRMTHFVNVVAKKALEIDADVYHLHDPELLPFGLRLKRKGKKVIFDSHEDFLNGMVEKSWIPHLIRPLVGAVFCRYAKYVYKKMDALITVTATLQTELCQLNSACTMITNYPKLQTRKDNIRDEMSKDFMLCFTGGIVEDWCHETILSAVERIENVVYTLCGPVQTEAYLAELKQHSAWVKVDFKGELPFEQVFHVQAMSNVGMAVFKPSKNSGGNIGSLGVTKLFEYMMAGIPVICTDFILWREIVDKYHCGICVNYADVDAIVDAIRYLKDNPKEAHEMGENGRRAVEREFNWGTQEEKLLALYSELLK